MTRVLVFLPVLAAALGHIAPPAMAQTRAEPQLLLTIAGGATSGASLYSGLRQPIVLPEDPFSTDTMALGRELAPGIVLGASATYFPSPMFGLTAEISFLGLGRDDTCSLVYQDQSPARLGYTGQVCDDIAAREGAASTIAFEAGALLRLFPRGAVKPYLSAHAGVTSRSASTVEVAGIYLQNGVRRSYLVINDPSPGAVEPTAAFTLGVMIPFATGYQARLAIRDRVLFADRVTGPADALATAPTETRAFHSASLLIMLDIVLEQRRGRRY
jgi:hypothetical protein